MNLVIIQSIVPSYRIAFFEALDQQCQAIGIRLRVVHGQADELMRPGVAVGDLTGRRWSAPVRNTAWLAGRITHLGTSMDILAADAVVLEHSLSSTAFWSGLVRSRIRGTPVAFWGIGRDMHHENGLPAVVRGLTLSAPDWWFTYTEGTAEYLAGHGVPPATITWIQNSSDTRAFRESLAEITECERAEYLQTLGLAAAGFHALYCGRLVPDKQIDVLLKSAVEIGRARPGFVLLVAGDGPLASAVRLEAARYPESVKYLGHVSGRQKALAFSVADMFLHPGRLGLAVLDACCAGIPIVTSEGVHGPEFEYLERGRTVLVSEDLEPASISRAALSLIDSPDALRRMGEAASAATSAVTAEEMAHRFVTGVVHWLGRGELQ